jgi:hypothetical protein
MNDLSLSQENPYPTRGENILDLILTTNPALVKEVATVPGISDHKIVTSNFTVKVKTAKQVPRTVYQFHKGDMAALKSEVKQASARHLEANADQVSVEQNWQAFKKIIKEAISHFIPTKKLGTWKQVPWLNRDLLRKVRKKQRLYNKAKKQGTDSETWKHYKAYRNHLRKEIDKAEENYINGLFEGQEETNEMAAKANVNKRLWTYVKSKKNDQIGIPALKDPAGRTVSDDAEKASLLNSFYSKVFTAENTSNIPSPGGQPFPAMPNIDITVQGVSAQLKRLNPKKAQGPDEIPLRVLKEAHEELAPLLTFIFNQSIRTGQIPRDWLSANGV